VILITIILSTGMTVETTFQNMDSCLEY